MSADRGAPVAAASGLAALQLVRAYVGVAGVSFLSQDDVDRLLLQLIAQTAPDPPSDEEAQAVVRWAECVRIEAHMLDLILAGDATVRIVNGEPSFKLTPQGMASAEQILAQVPRGARAARSTRRRGRRETVVERPR